MGAHRLHPNSNPYPPFSLGSSLSYRDLQGCAKISGWKEWLEMWGCHLSTAAFFEMHLAYPVLGHSSLRLLARHPLVSTSRPFKLGHCSIIATPFPRSSENSHLLSHPLWVLRSIISIVWDTLLLLSHSWMHEKLFYSSLWHIEIGRSPRRLTDTHLPGRIALQILHLMWNFRIWLVLSSPSTLQGATWEGRHRFSEVLVNV